MLALDILYEDNHCLVVNKAAGVASAHFQGRDETVDRAVKRYLKEKYHKPANVYLGIVHRLDRPVSGALLLARTSKGARRLSEQFRAGQVQKTYWAIVAGLPAAPSGRLTHWLHRDETHRCVSVVDQNDENARQAILDYRIAAREAGLTRLELTPHTGRKHQIRVQLAAAGLPVYGDRRYGSRYSFGPAIALHARALEFRHPTRDEVVTVTAPLPATWRQEFGSLLCEPG
jgi:23S rRNA pseudouridine1911/1915/1917 synthase